MNSVKTRRLAAGLAMRDVLARNLLLFFFSRWGMGRERVVSGRTPSGPNYYTGHVG